MKNKRTPTKILNWHIVFVQYCNLRCSYCSTGYGRFGNRAPTYMEKEVRDKLAERFFSYPDKNEKVSLLFEGGETLLKYREFFDFVLLLTTQAREKGVPLSITVVTNGVFIDDIIPGTCAELGIDLTFSIDGHPEPHDKNRKDAHGNPTHNRAFENWKYYKQCTQNLPNPVACSVQSVYTGDCTLQEMLSFWEQQNEGIVDITLQEPSRFLGKEGAENSSWDTRRRKYLEELKELAFRLAETYTVPRFLSDYKGPRSLYKMWKDIFLGTEISPCKAGIDTIGVTASGDLYPCEIFIGTPHRRLGDIFTGPDEPALEAFRQSRARALETCLDCDAGPLCRGGCFKPGPEGDVSVNSAGGCAFMKEVIDIAQQSCANLKEEM